MAAGATNLARRLDGWASPPKLEHVVAFVVLLGRRCPMEFLVRARTAAAFVTGLVWLGAFAGAQGTSARKPGPPPALPPEGSSRAPLVDESSTKEAQALVKTLITGSARFADGSPVAGARVSAGAHGSATTGGNGSFQFTAQVLPGHKVKARVEIEVHERRYRGTSGAMVVVPNGLTAVGPVQLEPDPFRFPGPLFPTGELAGAIVTGDFDEDRAVDVATADRTTTSSVNVLLGNGDETFGSPVEFPAGTNVSGLTAGDWDGDTHLDLAGASGGSLVLLLGAGDGTFVPL